MIDRSAPLTQQIGFLLTRVIVPLWVLAGAVLKLVERSPKLLPRNLWQGADAVGINLYWFLAILIALEFLAIGVMFFLPRLAKPMAIFMLASFCVILIGEIAVGNTKCGCLGAYSPSPWVMLGIDGTLLLAVLLLAKSPGGEPVPAQRRLPAGAFVLAGAVLCAVLILPENTVSGPAGSPTPTPIAGTGTTGTGTTATTPTGTQGGGPRTAHGGPRQPRPLPGYYTPTCASWVGQKWSQLDVAQYMPKWPQDIDAGLRYVVFYSRSCGHCQDMFERHFFAPPVPTTAIAIPERKDGFNQATWMPMPCNGCEELDLPVGTDWLFSTPTVVALENGVVKCAKEGDDPEAPQCLWWH